jgi:hypothetical protein
VKAKQFCKHVLPDADPTPTLKPLTIATPFHYAFHFIEQYLVSLISLDYPKELLTLVFAVQGNDDTYLTLLDFKKQWRSRYHDIIIEQRDIIDVGDGAYHINALNVCDQRNWLKNQTRDDILFIGHDNFPAPNTIKRLLQAQMLGADIAGGVYPFTQHMGLGFTSFFMLYDGKKRWHCTAILKHKDKLWFPNCLYGKRVWTWTVGMDCTLIKRVVLDKIDYKISVSKEVTDDVEYCYHAHEQGFNVLTDYGLWVPHWGYHIEFLQDNEWQGWIQVRCWIQPWLPQMRNLIKRMRDATLTQNNSKETVIVSPI